MHHQVGTKGDLSGLKTIEHQVVLQQAGIEHDITMVGNKQILLVGRQPFQTRCRELADATGDDLLVYPTHGVVLEFAYSLEGTHVVAHLFQWLCGIDKGSQQGEYVAVGNTLHGGGNLLFVIGTNVVELRVFNHIIIVFLSIPKISTSIGGIQGCPLVRWLQIHVRPSETGRIDD